MLGGVTEGVEEVMEGVGEVNGHVLDLRPADAESLDDTTCYHHIIGSLVYIGITRPDISHFVHILS